MFEFLSEENKAIAKKMLEEADFDNKEWVRWWSEDELQLDGNFSLEELKLFVKIMESFERE